jgi:hypothetical protein
MFNLSAIADRIFQLGRATLSSARRERNERSL